MSKSLIAYGLLFEDFTEKDTDGNWAYICKTHAADIPYGQLDPAGQSDTCLCGVNGCLNISEFYVELDSIVIPVTITKEKIIGFLATTEEYVPNNETVQAFLSSPHLSSLLSNTEKWLQLQLLDYVLTMEILASRIELPYTKLEEEDEI